MELDACNTKREWRESELFDASLLVLDAENTLVSCNARAQKLFLTNCSNKTIIFPKDCFWSREKQGTFFLEEFRKYSGTAISLLYRPEKASPFFVTVAVDPFFLEGKEYLSLMFRRQAVESANNELSTDFMVSAFCQDLFAKKLSVVYQPQINVTDNSLYGVEALARWSSDEFGDVSPDVFVEIAESYSIISELDFLIFNKACLQFVYWRDNGLSIPHISVNFSAMSFCDSDISNRIKNMLIKLDIPFDQLIIEITERTPFLSIDNVSGRIAELYFMGINVSLDDFGTEHSNLKRLLKFPISHLKLDRFFVHEFPNKMAVYLSRIIFNISQDLDALSIAEGVETQSQLSLLIEAGYQVVQGFLYSPPLSSAEFEQWIKMRISNS
ncbi:EAL domain-containing protein [Marinomonas posidonica]|uniref:EAL domain-containing protein n=1 Tax=Marinomonas posidonica TaxID=936476 RepID=UPI0037354B07